MVNNTGGHLSGTNAERLALSGSNTPTEATVFFTSDTKKIWYYTGGAWSDITPAGSASEAFAVGAVFIAVVATNPATLLGYGTWSAFGAGRVLVGLDSGDTDFDVVEEVGGAKTVTLTEAQIPAHTHAPTDPGHTHIQRYFPTATGGSIGYTADTSMSGTQTDTGLTTKSGTTGITIATTGGGGSHANVQPYIVVYMWKRTA